MGPPTDPTAVVDHGGQVYGTRNVFVADASIIPQIPRAGTNFTCSLIGWRIAERLSTSLGQESRGSR
jgi:choline dehydrogenase-like flavoprotein